MTRPSMIEQYANPENSTAVGRLARYALELEQLAQTLVDTLDILKSVQDNPNAENRLYMLICNRLALAAKQGITPGGMK